MTILQKFICGIALFLFGFFSAYKYQHYKYESIISSDKQFQSDQIIKANRAATETERKYQSLSDSYNLLLEKQKNELDKIAAANRAVVASRGLYVTGVCPKHLSASASSAGDSSNATATIRLSDTVSKYLSSAAERADQAALVAQAGHAYAVLMNQWIDEQSKVASDAK